MKIANLETKKGECEMTILEMVIEYKSGCDCKECKKALFSAIFSKIIENIKEKIKKPRRM